MRERKRWAWLLAAVLFLPILSFSQNTKVQSDTLVLRVGDTLRLGQQHLVPNSLRLRAGDAVLDTAAYALNAHEGWLILRDPARDGVQVTASYRYFPHFLQQRFALRTFRVQEDTAGGKKGVFVEEYYQGEEQVVLSPSAIRRSGSISRGLSVGNNQSLSVNSGLRLQLEGDLGDDLKLQAAITDESIPIQPDGTTQQINDFDKVFIQLIRRDDRVILGDFEIDHKGTQFANFYRNVQGIGFRVKDEKKGYAGVNGAVAKGKFQTNTFAGREGVQGPYRLTGRNGERFIIVLAGSEKVYYNGQLMTRGEGNDYVIDYNTGELTFTAQRLVSSATRIVIDFEYTDRNYNRSLLFADFGTQLLENKLTLKGSYGRDADNLNAPIDGPFSDTELDSLRAAGDNPELAAVTGIDSVGPPDNPSAVRYRKVDSLVYGRTFEAYVFGTDPATAVYRITFSQVGSGNGDYIREQNLVNGTVFRWVAPDSATGRPRGDYAPIRVLVPAKLLQVLDVAAEYKLSPKAVVYAEGAFSSNDINRFSAIDDKDNGDFAQKSGIRLDGLRLTDSLSLKVDASYRFVGETYTNLDRVYKVEYGREWNFDDLGERLDEHVTEGTAELRYGKGLRLTTNAGWRAMGDRLNSIKQLYELESGHKLLQGKYTFTTIGTEDKADTLFSRWTRHNGDIHKDLGPLRPGVELWMEDKSRLLNGESQDGAFRFTDLKPYLKTVGSHKLDMTLFYNYRREHEQLDSAFRDKSVAHTGSMKLIWNPASTLNLQNTSSLRRFNVLDQAFVTQKGLLNSQTLITNLQGSWFTKNRVIFSNLLYEVTSEQVARKQVAYIEVYPGQGDYEWIDADSNGVQSLDEFQYTTNPNRSNFYVRILIPSTQLFPTTALNFSGNFKLDLKKAWKRSENPLFEVIRNTSSITNFRVTQKKSAGNDLSSYLVNLRNVFGDTSLLDAQYTFRQDIYFFRNDPLGDIKFSYGDNKSKLFLVSGDETRSLRTWGTEQRLNFGKSKSIENEFTIGRKVSDAANFDSRSYDIAYWEVKPHLNFQLSRKLRLTTGYEYKHKVNGSDSLGAATVNLHKLSLDAKWNLKDRNNIFGKVELVRVGQEGTASFSAEYELRETLQPGLNGIWQVFSTIYLNKNLELSLTYDGRASEGKKTLHTGRVQLKAFF